MYRLPSTRFTDNNSLQLNRTPGNPTSNTMRDGMHWILAFHSIIKFCSQARTPTGTSDSFQARGSIPSDSSSVIAKYIGAGEETSLMDPSRITNSSTPTNDTAGISELPLIIHKDANSLSSHSHETAFYFQTRTSECKTERHRYCVRISQALLSFRVNIPATLAVLDQLEQGRAL